MEFSETIMTEYSGKKFFSQSLFRSTYALVATAQLIATSLGSSVFFYVYWNRLSTGVKEILFIILFLLPLRCVLNAWNFHKRVHDVYLKNELQNIPTDSPVHIALDVAAKAIVDDMLYIFMVLLTLLVVSTLLLTYPPK
jgi:hypothetical protein